MSKKVNLEKNIETLEEIVGGLESGELTLDDSIKNFEKGVKLYNECKSYLGDVESKIQVLTASLNEKDLE